MVMNSFWRHKKVLITGHTGFKGSWLCLWLNALGAKLTGYSLAPPSALNLFSQAEVALGINHIVGDVRDYEHLKKVIDSYQPEIIFHLAAQSLVRTSYQSPLETYATNVMGTAHLFEAVRGSTFVKAIVNITSDKCYANEQVLKAYQESDALGGLDPYSSSKACSELVTAAYRHAFFNPQDLPKHSVGIASARAGNVIGGGDWAKHRLIPDMMQACLAGQRPKIRNPQAIRPWQHVLDPLAGYLRLAQKVYENPQHMSEAWNFGPDEAQTVGKVAETLLQQWGGNLKLELEANTGPHEENFLALNCEKAKNRLSWQAKWPLELALQHTVQWYKAYQSGANMRAFTAKQIETYIHT
jgi:CDP-glucose 4,6-dehydratase